MKDQAAAFCCALNFAQRAFCAAAILRRAEADNGFLLTATGLGPADDEVPACFFRCAHLARCASEMRLRAAAESERPERLLVAPPLVLVRPDNPSITEIA